MRCRRHPASSTAYRLSDSGGAWRSPDPPVPASRTDSHLALAMADEASPGLAQLALQSGHLATPTKQGSEQKEHPRSDTSSKKNEQNDRQRRLPCGVKKETDADWIRVSERKRKKKEKQGKSQDPQQPTHHQLPIGNGRQHSLPPAIRHSLTIQITSSEQSTRSRNSFPALKCGTHFSGTSTFSPDFGFRPTRGGR